MRFAAARILGPGSEDERIRAIPKPDFIQFCDTVAAKDSEEIAETYRLPAADAEALVPALLGYQRLLAETPASEVLVLEASLRMGLVLDLALEGEGRGSRSPPPGAGERDVARPEVRLRRAARAQRRGDRGEAVRRADRGARPGCAPPPAARGRGIAARHRCVRRDPRTPQALAVHPLGFRGVRADARRHGARRERRPLPPARPAVEGPPSVHGARPRSPRRGLQAGRHPARGERARRGPSSEGEGRAHRARPRVVVRRGRRCGRPPLERLVVQARSDLFHEVFGRKLAFRERGNRP